MILQPTQDRLKAQVPTLKLVDGAAAFSALKTNPPKSKQPAAYVLPIADAATPNAVATAVRQTGTERIAVALALGNLKDSRGATASEQMEAIRVSVRGALVGWSPATGFEVYLYAGGRVIDMKGGVVWHQLEFTTQFQINA